MCGSRKCLIHRHHLTVLNIWIAWMPIKIAAHQFIIPCPIVLGIACCMNADKAAARLNIPLKIGLLSRIEHIARGVEPNDCAVIFKIIFIEFIRICSRIYYKTLFFTQFKEEFFSCCNRIMMKTSGF